MVRNKAAVLTVSPRSRRRLSPSAQAYAVMRDRLRRLIGSYRRRIGVPEDDERIRRLRQAVEHMRRLLVQARGFVSFPIPVAECSVSRLGGLRLCWSRSRWMVSATANVREDGSLDRDLSYVYWESPSGYGCGILDPEGLAGALSHCRSSW